MAQKHGAPPALGKLLQELEKLHAILRRYAVEPADCVALVERARRQFLSKPPRIRVQALQRYILRTACKAGHDYLRQEERKTIVRLADALEQEILETRLSATDEVALECERALLCYIMITELSPQRREVFRLNRCEGLNHKEIARRLNLDVEAVKDHLVEAMLVFEGVLTNLDNEGVVEKNT